MKKIYTVFFLSVCVVLLQSGVKSINNSSVPPAGYTGAAGSYCVDCHGSFALNSGGGGITVTGLPTGGYTLAGFYNTIAVTITHGTANRKKWGFSMKAVDAAGNAVGTFNSTNSRAKRNNNDQSELSHFSAATTAAGANTYTYDNLSWVAPGTNVGPVTFYYVGNAGDNAGGSSGDYIYSGSTVISLPIDLKNFTAATESNNVILKWQTATEINSNYFDVERSDDGQFFFSIGKVNATGNSSLPVSYSFTDTKLSNNNGSQIFYRLKLVDKDGSVKYSNHISVKPIITGVTIKNLYPAVVRKNDQVTIDIVSDKPKALDMIVMDETGRLLQYLKANLTTGSNTLKFVPQVNNMKGMLFIKFVTTNFQQTKALILQ